LVGETLDHVPRQRGRTVLRLASGGFLADAMLAEYREVVRRFVRAGVTAYFYDAREPSIDGDAGGALRLADETGGFPIRVSDATGLARLVSDAHHCYLLGYAPPNTKRDGKLRRIAVRVRAPGASVRAWKAYYAPTADDERAATSPAPAATPAAPGTPARSEEAAARYLALATGASRRPPRSSRGRAPACRRSCSSTRAGASQERSWSSSGRRRAPS
jgi:hypothetical protein